MGWAALVPLAVSAVSAIAGASAKKKAERERQRLAASRPELQNSEFVDEQVDLSRSELTRGNNTPGMVAGQQMMDANFSSSIDALLKSGGSPGNMADLYGQQQLGQMRFSMAQDDIRRANIQNLVRAGQAGEQMRQQLYSQNQWSPWADSSQANAGALQGATNQMWSGIGNAGSSAAYYINSLESQKKNDDYFNGWKNGIKNPYLNR